MMWSPISNSLMIRGVSSHLACKLVPYLISVMRPERRGSVSEKKDYLHAIIFWRGLGLKTWLFAASINKRKLDLLYTLKFKCIICLDFTAMISTSISPGLSGQPYDNHVLTILIIQKWYYSSISEKWNCVLSKLKQNLATCLSEQTFLRYMYLFELMLVRNI